MQVSYILTVGPSRLRAVLLYCSLLFTIPIQANPPQTTGGVTTERQLGIQLYDKGDPDGLTEVAIAAARKIKFVPAMKDGKSVSTFVQLEYNFDLY